MRVRYSFSSRRTGTIEGSNQHRKPYPKIVREVIGQSDLILEILDSRFVEATRNTEIEQVIKNYGKKVIYVLNKADLVETKKLKEKIETLGLNPYVLVSCKERFGSRELRELIKKEVKEMDIKDRRARVGVLGIPNTGKSSIINFLIGKKSARTAEESGFTRGIQKLKLNDDIVILDTPGVIPEKEKEYSRENIAKHSYLGARSYDKVKEPEFVVMRIMQRFPGVLEKFYKINAEGNSEILLEELGKKNNFLLKGGIIDYDRTSRLILKQWQRGEIRQE